MRKIPGALLAAARLLFFASLGCWAQISNPSIVVVPTAPSGSCSVNLPDQQVATTGLLYTCQNGRWAAQGGGGLGGTTWYAPVENFGAVGDWNGTTGTDNTTAIQNCLNSLATTGGQCLLQAKKYKTTAPLTISWSSVGIAGVSYGVSSTAISNQLAANVPLSEIITTSASADVIDVAGGSISAPISFNKFNDFSIARSQAGTGTGLAGAAGLSISYAGGWTIDRVWSSDSVRPFYFLNAGAYGSGYMQNSGVLWGFAGFTSPTVQSFGIYVDGSLSMESLRIRDSFAQTNGADTSGSVGLFVKGNQVNDLFVRGFETANMGYGIYIQDTGGGGQAQDIHLNDTVNDTCQVACVTVTGATLAFNSMVDIKGGWMDSQATSATELNISSSSGVTVEEVQFFGDPSFGVNVSSSNRVGISNNNFLLWGSGGTSDDIAISSSNAVSITGNTISNGLSANRQTTYIAATSLIRSTISGNTLSGYATNGITLDSASDNNSIIGVFAIDPGNITTPITNSGTGNNVVN
jgi:hypothetical protein